jgi:hypothetical protein
VRKIGRVSKLSPIKKISHSVPGTWMDGEVAGSWALTDRAIASVRSAMAHKNAFNMTEIPSVEERADYGPSTISSSVRRFSQTCLGILNGFALSTGSSNCRLTDGQGCQR